MDLFVSTSRGKAKMVITEHGKVVFEKTLELAKGTSDLQTLAIALSGLARELEKKALDGSSLSPASKQEAR